MKNKKPQEKVEYSINLYKRSQSNKFRFALGNKQSKNLHVIGINPSTASQEKPDHTLNKVCGFAHKNGFNGFLMFNIYPQRSTNPLGLHNEPRSYLQYLNYRSFYRYIKPGSTVLCAWGNLIELRPWLIKELEELAYILNDKECIVKCVRLTKRGHPEHLLRLPYDKEFEEFDLSNYLNLPIWKPRSN